MLIKKLKCNDFQCNINIKSILENCGLGNIWQTQDTISQQENNNTIQTIELRIKDMYNQSWYSAINNTNKLETYSLFKQLFCMTSERK